MTPYGTRQQMRGRLPAQGIGSRPVQDVLGGTARRWEYLLWFVALAILGLVVLAHLLGSGAHGH